MYKMDFDEERESREKLATEKEKIADELRAMQQENNQLNVELEALKRQTPQPRPAFGSSARSVAALIFSVVVLKFYFAAISAHHQDPCSPTTTTQLLLQAEAEASGQALDTMDLMKTIQTRHQRFDFIL